MSGRTSTQVALLLVVCLSAALVFRGAFISWDFLVPVIGGVLLSAIVSVAGHRAGLSFGWAALASIVAYLALGTAIIFGTPGPDRLLSMVEESVRAWRGLLTIAAPVDPARGLRVVPFVSAWAGAFLGTEAVLRSRSLVLPLTGPVLILALAASFGLQENRFAAPIGLTLTISVVAFLVTRTERSWLWRIELERTGLVRRSGAATVVLALAAVGGMILGPLLPVTDEQDRSTLRTVVEPPFEIRQLRTPLASFKDSLRDDAEDDVVMVVSGPEMTDRRIRLATLDQYNGVIWTTAGAVGDRLVPVGPRFPGVVDGWTTGPDDRFRFELDSLSGNWLPTVGTTQSIEWDDGAESLLEGDPQERLRVDPTGGNLLIDRGIGPEFHRVGLAYEVEAVDQPDPGQLTDRSVVAVGTGIEASLVAPFRSLATAIIGQAGSDFNKVARIEAALGDYRPDEPTSISTNHRGKNPTYDIAAPPGHALFRVRELIEGDADEYRGTAEQYATTFAVLNAAVGIPSRVVVGYVVADEMIAPGQNGLQTATIRRSDLAVWIEVPFEGVGWVPFRAGPEETAIPEGTPLAGGGSRSFNTVPPPPPVDRELGVQTVAEVDDEAEICEGAACDDEDSADRSTSSRAVALVTTATGGPLLLFALYAALVGYLKVRRRRRRRAQDPARSVAGAWREILDAERDAGARLSSTRTLRELVGAMQDHPAVGDIADLSKIVEATAYGGPEPSPAAASLAWQKVDDVERSRSSAESRVRTVRRKLSPASLLAPVGTGSSS